MLQLETNRLLFRRYVTTDLPFITELVRNSLVMQYIDDGHVKNEAYANELLLRMQQQYDNFDDYGLHALICKKTGQLIGHAGFVAQVIDDCFEIELGYWIHPNYWRQGFASEATQALKQYAVDEWEIERFVSMIMVGNEGSVRIAEKNGLTLEKVFLQHEKEVQLFSYCKK